MVLRRRRNVRHPELEQVHAAREAVERRGGNARALALIDDVEASLELAIADRNRLRAGLADLDLERATRELKDALHARASVTEADTPAIAALRQRYDTIHVLRRRLVDVEEQIATTLIDLDTMRANMAAMPSFDVGTPTELSARLADDAAALRSAHEEVEAIGGLR